MRIPRSHYQACLEADVLTESSGLGSSKHDSSASVVFPGHLSFLPACAAILDFKNVTPLGPSRRSIPPISMAMTD